MKDDPSKFYELQKKIGYEVEAGRLAGHYTDEDRAKIEELVQTGKPTLLKAPDGREFMVVFSDLQERPDPDGLCPLGTSFISFQFHEVHD